MTDLRQNTAIILAGGLGTRLRPVVFDRPKVLAPVNHRPFIFSLLDQLERAGLRHVVIATGYGAEAVTRAICEAYPQLDLEFSREPEPLGTGGAIALAAPRVTSDEALILNGDSYCRVDFEAIARFHRAHGAKITLVSTPMAQTERYGRLAVAADGALTAFHEKRRGAGQGEINAGIYLVSRSVLSALPTPAAPFSWEEAILPRFIGRGLYRWRSPGPFLDIGVPSDYALAEAFFRRETSNRASQGANQGANRGVI